MKNSRLLLLGTALATLSFDTGAAPFAVAVQQINLNGYRFFADSFNSSDTNQSTGGLYDPLKAGDQGNVGSESGINNSINVGNVEIWGQLATAPESSITLGPFGSVGSAAWHLTGQLGIEPGFLETDFAWVFPDVVPPFAGLTPTGGSDNGVFCEYLLSVGDYQMPALTMSGSQKLLVTGQSTLTIAGNVSLSGNASILILPSGSLRLYVGGSTASLRGDGVINQGPAKNFLYLGLARNTEVNIRLGAPLRGCVYAPASPARSPLAEAVRPRCTARLSRTPSNWAQTWRSTWTRLSERSRTRGHSRPHTASA